MSCEERVYAAVDWVIVAWFRFCVAILLAPITVVGLVLFAIFWLEEAVERWKEHGKAED
jgi:hypothetical protein